MMFFRYVSKQHTDMKIAILCIPTEGEVVKLILNTWVPLLCFNTPGT